MPLLRYVGGFTEVYVVALGATVERGGQLEVSNPDIAASLVDGGNWAAVEAPAPAPARRAHTAPAAAPADAKEA